MSRVTFVLIALFALTSLAGCNTFHGFGKDLTSAGKAITGDEEHNSNNNGY